MTDRDTKFLGFAQAQFNKLSELGLITLADPRNFQDNPDRMIELQAEMNQLTKQILAHAAYDLVKHALLEVDLDGDYYGRFFYDTPAIVNSIPDLTEWPR
jgi:hypothetical protein